MSYTLLFRVCSMLHIACMAPMSDGVTYPDFSSCVLSGTKVANELIITLTPEEINKDLKGMNDAVNNFRDSIIKRSGFEENMFLNLYQTKMYNL